jgi:hypothetical protein
MVGDALIDHLPMKTSAKALGGERLNALKPFLLADEQSGRAMHEPLLATDVWVHEPREPDRRFAHDPRHIRMRETGHRSVGPQYPVQGQLVIIGIDVDQLGLMPFVVQKPGPALRLRADVI